jgi:hypothetical protein
MKMVAKVLTNGGLVRSRLSYLHQQQQHMNLNLHMNQSWNFYEIRMSSTLNSNLYLRWRITKPQSVLF